MVTGTKESQRGVYKFRHAGVIYYRLGRGLNDAAENLARELKTSVIHIEILDSGQKQ